MTMQDLDTGLFTSREFERRLAAEVERAAADGRPYAVVACVPQHLPSEGVDDIVRVAASCVRNVVRDGDVAGRLTNSILAVGLPGTPADGARVFAHRLQNELRLRSYHLRNTVWDADFATMPEGGSASQELIQCAIEAAKTRRRRIALSSPSPVPPSQPFLDV